MSSIKLNNAKLYVDSQTVIKNAYLMVDKGKVVDYGECKKVTEKSEFLNLNGATILPGLIDSNTHISIPDSGYTYTEMNQLTDGYLSAISSANAESTLKGGITTVRDVGGLRYIDIDIRDAIKNNVICGPTILAAGRAICITGGHGSQFARVADGVNEVLKAVREQYDAGADSIKIIVSGGVLTEKSKPCSQDMSTAEIICAVNESHRLGMKVAAHCQNKSSVYAAVGAGVDSIEHGIQLDLEVVDKMKENGTHLVPTLSAPAKLCSQGNGRFNKSIIEKCKRIYDEHRESIQLAAKNNVNIMMGSDAGTPFNFHGDNRMEIGYMCELGIKFSDALHYATVIPSKYLSLDGAKGKLDIGYDADMLISNTDPADDYKEIFKEDFVKNVYKSGIKVI